jgi:hypothetical protein
MKHVKLFESFIKKSEVNEGYFTEDKTSVEDQNAYSDKDFKNAASEIKPFFRELKVTASKNSIIVVHKVDDHYIGFEWDEDAEKWIASFEDGLVPAGDQVAMSLDEFIEEVIDWAYWYRDNRED